MTIIRLNHLTAQVKSKCNRQNRSYDDLPVRQLYRYRHDTELLQSATLPISSIGGKTHFNEARVILKRIKGVKVACLLFHQTALRVYFVAEQTSVNDIIKAMQVLKNERYDLQAEKYFSKTMRAI